MHFQNSKLAVYAVLRRFNRKYCISTVCSPKSKNVSIYRELKGKIKATGPITVADYMRTVLTNPFGGYYMTKDNMFGKDGDFVTSPEISQLFGEMIAVWLINEWTHLGSHQPVQVIELGPGRGRMMEDIIRVFSRLKMNNFSIHLVEISNILSNLQAERLKLEDVTDHSDQLYHKSGKTKNGIQVYWYKSLQAIDIKHFTMVIAHEFFDAIPIHKFQKTDNNVWREVLIDIDEVADKNGQEKFRYVISRSPTPGSLVFVPENECRREIEVAVDSILIMQHLGQKFKEHGGIGLIIDYGHCSTKEDTFRAFKNHKQCDPLSNPGHCDLTADVDFNILKNASKELITFGPVTQREFLIRMKIEIRLQMLLQNCDKKISESLISGCNMLLDENQMGSMFHFMSFVSKTEKDRYKLHPPYAFSD